MNQTQPISKKKPQLTGQYPTKLNQAQKVFKRERTTSNSSILDEIDEHKQAYLQKENTTTYRSILDEPSPLSFNQESTTTHRSIVNEIEPKRTTTTSYRSILDEPSSLSFNQNSATRQRSIVDEIEPKRTTTTSYRSILDEPSSLSFGQNSATTTHGSIVDEIEPKRSITTSYRSILDEPSSLSFGQNSATTTHRSIVDEIEPKRTTTTSYRSILDEPSSFNFGQNSATTTNRSIVDEIEPKRTTTTSYRSILDEPSSLIFTRNSATTSIVDDIEPKRKTTTTYKSILDEIDEPNGNSDLQTIDTLGPLADIIERSNQSPRGLNSFQYLDQPDQSFSGAQEVTTPGIDSEVPIIVASSDEALSPDPKERKGLFSSRVKSSQNWVRSFPGRSGNSEIHFSDSSVASPDIYEDRGYDYSYVTTATRKVKPKDQKILSYETTEKVPILTASSPEVEESFEKITIETPHVSDIPPPEVSAHHFGSPPKKLIDSLSKSHFEFSASDAPLITPPIERHRQAVVDKYLADKTRGGNSQLQIIVGGRIRWRPNIRGRRRRPRRFRPPGSRTNSIRAHQTKRNSQQQLRGKNQHKTHSFHRTFNSTYNDSIFQSPSESRFLLGSGALHRLHRSALRPARREPPAAKNHLRRILRRGQHFS